jgi:hypothetical protein
MRAIEVSRGTTTTYLGHPIQADWYTVLYKNRIVIRTTSKRVAYYYYTQLPA